MSEPERDYLDIAQADAERFEQAKWIALQQLQSEALRCWTMEDFNRWCDRVNERTLEIMQRPN